MRRLTLVGVFLAARLASGAVPSTFPGLFSDLSAFADQEELSLLETAEATYKAARFFAVGADGLSQASSWFRSAATKGQASVAGLYLSVHGRAEHLLDIRRELETNEKKRAWVWEIVGSEEAFFEHLESGKAWASLLHVLPSLGGCRQLSHLLMASPDRLARRAGLYWGYWTADASYGKRVSELAAGDQDPVTRRIAARLVQMRSSA
jgi:hypothetical protein